MYASPGDSGFSALSLATISSATASNCALEKICSFLGTIVSRLTSSVNTSFASLEALAQMRSNASPIESFS